MLVAQLASPEDAEPVSSSSWTAVAMIGTLTHKHKHTHVLVQEVVFMSTFCVSKLDI